MVIRFLGTRGYIDARTRLHYRHAAALISYRSTRVMLDCGLDWRTKVWDIAPDALVLTHGHPDHAWGLYDGSPCPVYATRVTWRVLGHRCPVEDRRIITPRKPFNIGNITFEAFDVVHSIRAPAVGYRITAGRTSIFYVPDLIKIKQQHAALRGVDLYIGDGASLVRPIVRRRGSVLFGHTTIRAQLGWCHKEQVSRAIFSHCGSQIVTGDGRTMRARVAKLGRERDVEASLAYDGLQLKLA